MQRTALFWNNAAAYELGRTWDRFALFYPQDGDERPRSVATELRGPLAGRRAGRSRRRSLCQADENAAAHELSAATTQAEQRRT